MIVYFYIKNLYIILFNTMTFIIQIIDDLEYLIYYNFLNLIIIIIQLYK